MKTPTPKFIHEFKQRIFPENLEELLLSPLNQEKQSEPTTKTSKPEKKETEKL